VYTLGLRAAFVAQHYLIGGDWGDENELHSHHYGVEVRLGDHSLDEHGYVVDIVKAREVFEVVLDSFRDRELNGLPPFAGVNPSLERFARVFLEAFQEQLPAGTSVVAVRFWEDDIAWAEYRPD
jgi:6-pyruvoyltetrahydropterin/6-carboxytetrahydropterin synthase